MKFCVNCGNELAESMKFCNRCGQARSTQPAEETQFLTTNEQSANNDPMNMPVPASTPNQLANNETEIPYANQAAAFNQAKPFLARKWKIISIALAGIVLIIISALVVFNQFVEKNPKNLYLLAEAKSLNNGANPIVGLVEQAIMVNTTGKGFNENETIISGSFDATGGDLDSRVAGIIEDSAIKYLHQHDSKSGQNNYTLSYLYDNEPLLSTIILTDVDRMALQIPEVSEQTYLLRDKNLEKKKGGAASTSSSQLALSKKYTELFIQHLQDKHFTLTEDAPYQYAGKTGKYRKITVKLSKDEVKKLMTEFIDTLRHDDELLQNFVNSVLLSGVVAQQGIANYSEDDREELVETLRDELYNIKLVLNGITFTDGFTMDVILDKKENIIARELEFDMRNEDGEKVSITYNTENKVENKIPISTFEFELSSNGSERGILEINGETSGELKDDSGQWKLKLDINMSENRYSYIDGEIIINAERKKGNSGIETTYDFEADSTFDEGYSRLNVEGEILHIFNDKNKDKSVTNNYELQLELDAQDGDSRDSVNFGLVIENTKRTNKDLKMAQFDSSLVSIPSLSDEELYEIQEDLFDDFTDYGEKLVNKFPQLEDFIN